MSPMVASSGLLREGSSFLGGSGGRLRVSLFNRHALELSRGGIWVGGTCLFLLHLFRGGAFGDLVSFSLARLLSLDLLGSLLLFHLGLLDRLFVGLRCANSLVILTELLVLEGVRNRTGEAFGGALLRRDGCLLRRLSRHTGLISGLLRLGLLQLLLDRLLDLLEARTLHH